MKPWWLLLLLLLVPRRRGNGSSPDYSELPKPPPKPGGQQPLWPLLSPKVNVHRPGRSFGAARPSGSKNPTKHHAGIDIGAEEGDWVLAPERGRVVAWQGWAGGADFNPARAMLIETEREDGPVILLGAVRGDSRVEVGQVVERGEPVAQVGRYPGGDTMLHFELYERGTRKNARWFWGQPKPPQLIDPTTYLAVAVDS